MHTQQQPRVHIHRSAVVGDVRTVGSAYLVEPHSAAGHDVGNAKAIADLDQLAAGDDNFSVPRQLIQHEKDRRGVVVDDNRRSAEKLFQQLPGMDIALAALALTKLILQIAVASGSAPDRLDGPRRKRRPSGDWCAESHRRH